MAVNYLRISVTDRCNLKCIYCHPLGGCDLIDHEKILTFEEIRRIVRLFVKCGIRKVRLTGGEPLVRKDIVELVRELAGIDGIEQLALTTNGVLLEPMAGQLKEAGLQRVNISVDSAQRQSYKHITRYDLLPEVTKGIHKAIEVGFTAVKINAVILKGINESEIPALARMSTGMPLAVRFIEYCPTSKYTKPASAFIPNSEVRKVIERELGPLSPALVRNIDGPALNFKLKDSAGTIGFISGRSSTFCRNCNRLRLTSDGKVSPCLYSAHSYDVKGPIRAGAGDREVLDLLKKILDEKSDFTKLNSPAPDFSMQNIGG
ncbi:MAG: GTP 3',8-cyclase MoaA [Planctomycetota bacterium]|jgi:cyclic pyranopterin phosphate synthase